MTWGKCLRKYTPVESNVNPGGQTHVNDPSVFTQVPPPRQIALLSSHSFTSEHTLPSTYDNIFFKTSSRYTRHFKITLAKPLAQEHSCTWHNSHGLPQAWPIEQQHSLLSVNRGKLFSHRPAVTFVQQDPFLLSVT